VIRSLVRVGLLVAGLLAGLPAGSAAQVFLASRPNPGYTVGPLYVRASVTPELGDLAVDVLWSLVLPPGGTAAAVAGDLFLLWPSAVLPVPSLGPTDPATVRYVEERGFSPIEDGRLELSARKLSATAERTQETIPGGAPFVTFVRQGGALGLTAPATYVRIPWTPRMVEPGWLMRLSMKTKGLIKPKANTWTERAFWGQRYRLMLSYQDVNARALFPLYLEHRTHVVRLAEDPAQLRIDFAQADHLKIDEIAPPSSRRQLSESRDNTEVVTLFLDRSEGITPQTLTVQFGYFSQLQSWAPILIPIAFFALGNLAAPIFRMIGLRAARAVRARVHFGRPDRAQAIADEGVVLSDETLARIKPGETTAEEVQRLCGPPEEEEQLLGASGRTLVYRGRRLVPQRKRSWGWIGTVDHWEMEHQQVGITIDNGIVRDVQARVRRTRLTHPDVEASRYTDQGR
jgi:hypothetical protein